jgi:hypothetical protein
MDQQATNERKDLNQQVEQILRSRRICRPVRGHPLSNAQQNLLERLRQHLLDDLMQASHRSGSAPSQTDEWGAELCQLAFRKVLDDEILTQLAISAQNYPAGTVLRRHALGELIQAIQMSGQIRWHHSVLDGIDGREVMNKTLIYICEHIDQFDAERGNLMAWVNNQRKWILHRTKEEYADPWIRSVQGKWIRQKAKLKAVLKAIKSDLVYGWLQFKTKEKRAERSGEMALITILLTALFLAQLPDSRLSEALNEIVSSWESIPFKVTEQYGEPIEFENMEELKLSGESPFLSEQIREYLQDDPDQIFQKSVKGFPAVTFQKIALDYLNDVSWKTLSNQWSIPVPTLSSFYQRELKRLGPDIRRYIQDNG